MLKLHQVKFQLPVVGFKVHYEDIKTSLFYRFQLPVVGFKAEACALTSFLFMMFQLPVVGFKVINLFSVFIV